MTTAVRIHSTSTVMERAVRAHAKTGSGVVSITAHRVLSQPHTIPPFTINATHSLPGELSVAPRIVQGPFSSPHFGHGCWVNGGKSSDGADHLTPSSDVANTDLLYHVSLTGAVKHCAGLNNSGVSTRVKLCARTHTNKVRKLNEGERHKDLELSQPCTCMRKKNTKNA